MCGNEIKPRMLVSPGVYKGCNVPSDSYSRYDDQKKNFIVKKLLRPVSSQGIVEQAKKKMANDDPSE